MKFYDNEQCHRCGVIGQMAHHHLIPGNGTRKLCDKYGLVVPLCPKCHEYVHSGRGVKTLQQLRRYGQLKAMNEQKWTEQQFREVFGKSYLGE